MDAWHLAQEIHKKEAQLIEMLKALDKKGWYVQAGHRTMGGFLKGFLKFSKPQAQRLMRQIRCKSNNLDSPP